MRLMRDREHLMDWILRFLLSFIKDKILRDSRVLHIVQVIDSWKPFQLVLNHLLILWLMSKDSLQEGLNIGNNGCVHLVALLGRELPK